jgi:type IV pilus assembly protein PilX
MRSHRSPNKNRAGQRGVVLFIALILLLILSLLGVTAARMQTVEERMARNEDNRQTGAQAAEAALRSAEAGLLTGIYTNFTANTGGQYTLDATQGSVVPGSTPQGTPTFQWKTATAANVLTYAGPALTQIPSGAQLPKFIIESMPPVAMPGDPVNQVQYAAPTPPVAVYRITANGQGSDQTSATTLQSIFR